MAVRPMELTEKDIGAEIGVSDWISLSQREIDAFGGVTRDPDRMHIDPEWARAHSPFGAPIVFGFQTLSMLTYFCHLLLDWGREDDEQVRFGLNYGFDRVRFCSPLRVDVPLRCRMQLTGIEHRGPDTRILRIRSQIEAQGSTKPVLVADWLVMFVANSELAAADV
jgi:acyl dehydratase